MVIDILLLILALIAAWSMGHHYAGAVVGPAFGSKAIPMYWGILLAGIFTLIGAVATPVISTYVALAPISGIYNDVVLISLIAITNLTTYLKVPTSTIQVYAFALMGTAFVIGASLNAFLLLLLVIGWITSPAIAFFLGKGIHHVIRESPYLRYIIIAILCYSGLVLGLNDVSNAASSLVASGFESNLAKLMCGAAMFVGMLTWGSRLIKRVGEELIKTDYLIAVAAQLTQSIILSVLNLSGLNASMNQTTVAALAGLGANKKVLRNILLGWIYSPLLGFSVAVILSFLTKSLIG